MAQLYLAKLVLDLFDDQLRNVICWFSYLFYMHIVNNPCTDMPAICMHVVDPQFRGNIVHESVEYTWIIWMGASKRM